MMNVSPCGYVMIMVRVRVVAGQYQCNRTPTTLALLRSM